MATSTRVLELLGLLQSRRQWAGHELARQLEVSPRTLRRDVDSLQDLGYPILTTRGTGGGYELAPGTSLPPLVVTEDEAAAIVMGLKEIATAGHPTASEAALSAMAKIVQVLPNKIRRRIDSLRVMTHTASGEENNAAILDIGALTMIALCCRDAETLSFSYRNRTNDVTQRTVHPHRLVNIQRRFYLIAYDPQRAGWRTFRVDRIHDPNRIGTRFTPRELPVEDPVELVQNSIAAMSSRHQLRATIQAPAHQVQAHIGHYGTVESITEQSCMINLPAESLDWATFCLAAIGAPFTLHEPPEAIHHARQWSQRLAQATEQ